MSIDPDPALRYVLRWIAVWTFAWAVLVAGIMLAATDPRQECVEIAPQQVQERDPWDDILDGASATKMREDGLDVCE